jgi:uroporphyrinogen decarboxylase
VAEGQLRLRARYGHDCYYPFYYAAAEVEAFGGEAIFIDDGPPNAGEPVLRRAEEILTLAPPVIAEQPVLLRVLETIRLLAAAFPRRSADHRRGAGALLAAGDADGLRGLSASDLRAP